MSNKKIILELRRLYGLEELTDKEIKDNYKNSLAWQSIAINIAFKNIGGAIRNSFSLGERFREKK